MLGLGASTAAPFPEFACLPFPFPLGAEGSACPLPLPLRLGEGFLGDLGVDHGLVDDGVHGV